MRIGHATRAILVGVGAAALGFAAQAGATVRDGVVGSTSTGSIRISISVAATGELTFVERQGAAMSSGVPACLWLNSGTGQYRLTALPESAQSADLRWQVGSQSVTLRPGAVSRVLEAPTRPSCRADEMASLSVGESGTAAPAHSTTLIVAPE
jgi:hypothetical protein